MQAKTDTLTESMDTCEVKALIDFLISELGVPSHLKGYKYLALAVSIVYKNPEAIRSVITGLYSIIADIYSTTVSCVERDMRTALKIAASSEKATDFDEYFSCALTSTNVIQPRRFIAILSERLRCHLVARSAGNNPT